MAWRHRSRQEKLLLRVIAFLSFVLAAFIIAVIAMDLAYKSEIRKLEDEVQAMKTTPAIVTSTEVISTLATSSSTSSRNATSSTESFTTPPEEDTTTPLTETPSDDEITAEEVTTPSQEGNPAKLVSADGLVEALRA